jgi:hypothetical protein
MRRALGPGEKDAGWGDGIARDTSPDRQLTPPDRVCYGLFTNRAMASAEFANADRWRV